MLKRLLLSFLLVSGISMTTVACSDDPGDDNPELDAGEDSGGDTDEADADADEPDADADEPDADADEPDADADEPDADADEPDADADEPDVDPGPTTGELDDPEITAESCDAIDTNICTINDDCEASEVCFDVSRGNDVACCVPGTRGTFELGDTCDPDNGQLECASSLCIQDDDETFSICTDACESDDDCVDPISECNAFLGICLTPSPE